MRMVNAMKALLAIVAAMVFALAPGPVHAEKPLND
jgi:hypothetical protein